VSRVFTSCLVALAASVSVAPAHAQPPAGSPPATQPAPSSPPTPYAQPPQAPSQPTPPAQPEAEDPEPEDLEPSIVEDSWLLVAAGAFIGGATEESFDDVLSSRGYAPAPRVWGGDASVAFRTLDWLWLGGRLDLRARDWARTGQASANAVGMGAMAVAEARLRVNRNVDVGLGVGVGLGVVGLAMNQRTATWLSPKLHLGAPLAFTIAEPARLFARVSWDYMRASNFNEFGHDVNLSGASLTVGLEVRR
jgi:hypothetical protein